MTDKVNKPTHITIIPNGPMRIEGSCELTNASDCLVGMTEEVYLCRCGHSSNKPFCDKTHKTIDWQDKMS